MNDTLPPLPNWVFCDDLGGLVPSEIRSAMVAYAREALAAYEALAAHDAEQAQEAQQAAQVGALPEPLTDDDAYRIVCEFFNQPWYRRVATEVVRATEKAHGIGATTGKEPGNV